VLLFAVGGKPWDASEPLHVGFVQVEPTMVPLLELVEALDDEDPELVEAPDDEELVEAPDDEELVEAPDDEELVLVWPPPDDDDACPAPAPDEDLELLPVPPDPPLPFELEQAATRSRPRPMGREQRIMTTSLGKLCRTSRSATSP
jgi:hypothetical protein